MQKTQIIHVVLMYAKCILDYFIVVNLLQLG